MNQKKKETEENKIVSELKRSRSHMKKNPILIKGNKAIYSTLMILKAFQNAKKMRAMMV